MKKKLLSLLLLAVVAVSGFAGCGGNQTGNSSTPDSTSTPVQTVDYAEQVTLDMSSSATIKVEVQLKSHVDGDTSHFYLPDVNNLPEEMTASGMLKARYLAVNTPESTGTIEEWGKAASKFTKERLTNASSIVIETDNAIWDHDANGRWLLWIWYKPQGGTSYRNLNVELLQNGLAWGSKTADSRYGSVCSQAIQQARESNLYIYSNKPDPDYYYGEAKEITMKELRTNIASYSGKRVAVEGVISMRDGWNVYAEAYDDETGMYYGISVFYGYHSAYHDILNPGNRVRLVGEVNYYEAGDSYQLSDLRYDAKDPDNLDHIKLLETGKKGAFVKTTVDLFNSEKTVDVVTLNEDCDPVVDEESGETVTTSKSFPYCQLALSTSVIVQNLTVKSIYTTNNGGDNDGAMTLTCEDANGKTIEVRTGVLRDADNKLITAEAYQGKTITVRGIVDVFSGDYQIKVFAATSIVVK